MTDESFVESLAREPCRGHCQTPVGRLALCTPCIAREVLDRPLPESLAAVIERCCEALERAVDDVEKEKPS